VGTVGVVRHGYGGNGTGRHVSRWRVQVARAYGLACRGACEELAALEHDVLLGALDIAETPGELGGPHGAAASVLRDAAARAAPG
jgi:hypothetical protein